jgi:hypothetical protein
VDERDEREVDVPVVGSVQNSEEDEEAQYRRRVRRFLQSRLVRYQKEMERKGKRLYQGTWLTEEELKETVRRAQVQSREYFIELILGMFGIGFLVFRMAREMLSIISRISHLSY